MIEDGISTVNPNDGALSAEHYQTFELAKENDSVLGGDDMAQIRSYSAFARARAQAIHKTIATMDSIDNVAATKAEMNETAQTFAKVSIYADQRIGEILRELPKAKNQYDESVVGVPTKREAEKQAGIGHATAIDLQKLAANPDVVQAVIDRAESEGRIPSRQQVIDAIRERDAARADAATARKVGETLKGKLDNAQEEIEALEKQNDELYNLANTQQVIEHEVVREVAPKDYDDVKRRNRELEGSNRLYSDDNQKLRKKLEKARKELDQAKALLGEKGRTDNAQWDIEALTTATNNYLRQYGGKAWAFDQFYRVNETAQAEFVKAINNLAAFAQNLAQMIKEQPNE